MRILLICLLLLSGIARAQFTYEIDETIPVTGESAALLKFPWAGGLNAVQVNTLDLNDDDIEDLIVYDRMSDIILTFIRQSGEYQHAPEYELLFPEDVSNWMLLRDFNGDGLKDIFTGDVLGGIRVYVNKTPAGGTLTWQQFFTISGNTQSPLLLTKGITEKIILGITYDDLPSISDADGDGDLDIFTIEFPAGSNIEYHQNFSVERGNGLDSLDFERASAAWAGVRECSCGEFAFNNDPCDTGGRLNHAGGKSLFAFDADNDGDQDMLFSEAECDQLFLFENTGNNSSPVVTTAVPYPGVASLVNFPAPYYEDVDLDGVKDLLLSPNLFAREFFETNFKQPVWFYKNTGTTAEPVFSAPDKNFLQRDMIDVGDNAVPAFFDLDGDGDEDLLIGCYINTSHGAGSIYFFENTGSSLQPEFTFVTDDYLDLSEQEFINIKPSFADMNGDGKIDLVFSAQDGLILQGNTRLYYFANENQTGANFPSAPIDANFAPERRDETITVTDVDRDGKKDLLIGKLNGAIEYWRNTGTATAPVYSLAQENFLNLSSTVIRQYPAITIRDLNADGRSELIYGDQTGVLTIISAYQEATNASGSVNQIIYNPASQEYSAQNLGGRIWPTTANLFGANKPQLVAGNILGGLHILKHDERHVPGDAPKIDVYPNPVLPNTQLLNLRVDQQALLQVVSLMGQEIGNPVTLQAGEDYSYKIIPGMKGIYILRFLIKGKSYIRKIVIR